MINSGAARVQTASVWQNSDFAAAVTTLLTGMVMLKIDQRMDNLRGLIPYSTSIAGSSARAFIPVLED
jgi:hypothetical protein